MEALAFIQHSAFFVLTAWFDSLNTFRTDLNPSEDSEALQRIDSGIPLHDRGSEAQLPAIDASAAPWFAVYTTCRHEKRVAQHLQQREIEHFLPLYTTQRRWRDGSKVTLELPLFPCYIFVRMRRLERARVLNVPGALTIVIGTGGDPAAIHNASLEALRQGIAAGAVEPHPLLTVGQSVRIHRGPFAGLVGVVARKKNGFRVVLTLQQIMQSVVIEVDENDLELLDDRAASNRLAGNTTSLHWQRT